MVVLLRIIYTSRFPLVYCEVCGVPETTLEANTQHIQ